MNKLSLSVVVITFNEEKNISHLLDNINDMAEDIVVLDSGSTDATVEIAQQYNARVYCREFDNFSNQRNYALKEIKYTCEWILILDADEVLSDELKQEMRQVLTQDPEYDAFVMKRRFYWMGAWVKRGYYPVWLLRLGRVGKIVCDERGINEHLVCLTDRVGHLQHDFIDENHKGISDWLAKHNRYSDFEAQRLIEDTHQRYDFWASQYERKRWLRVNIWNKMPLFFRPFALLFYRLVIRGGILDGRRAIVYHFLHAFFYRFLIEAKLLEILLSRQRQNNGNEKNNSDG